MTETIEQKVVAWHAAGKQLLELKRKLAQVECDVENLRDRVVKAYPGYGKMKAGAIVAIPIEDVFLEIVASERNAIRESDGAAIPGVELSLRWNPRPPKRWL